MISLPDAAPSGGIFCPPDGRRAYIIWSNILNYLVEYIIISINFNGLKKYVYRHGGKEKLSKEEGQELVKSQAAEGAPPEESGAGAENTESEGKGAQSAETADGPGAGTQDGPGAGTQDGPGAGTQGSKSEFPKDSRETSGDIKSDTDGAAAAPEKTSDTKSGVPPIPEESGAGTGQENSGRPVLSPAVKKFFSAAGFYLLRGLCVLLLTLAVAVGALYGLIRIMVDGPSETARELFVMSVRETSAIGFLADMFLTPEEIAQIEAGREIIEYPKTDTSLVTIEAAEPGTKADEWGLADEDGDGIVIDEVKGEGYSGYMMVVYDPSRVILGCVPEALGSHGYTVEGFVKYFDAVAGINGGGFADENGQGNGSTPDKAVVYDGQMYYGGAGTGSGFVGLDYDHKLHVGLIGDKAVREANIQYGCSFGPVLVSNGVGTDPDKLESGINPRTAIGQRSDGAILMLVIDGRQVISLGATYADLTEIMLRYGAVNACNLDGGSSSLMYYNGAYVNDCASVIGIRDIPTSFIVLKEGADGGE